MIVRDYGFASYLIFIGHNYYIVDGNIEFNITPIQYEQYNITYKKLYQKKDRIMRDLIKKIKEYK